MKTYIAFQQPNGEIFLREKNPYQRFVHAETFGFGDPYTYQSHDWEAFEQTAIANARLIAAAPKLLEALQELLRHAPSVEEFGWKNNATEFDNSLLGAALKAESAINKALKI